MALEDNEGKVPHERKAPLTTTEEANAEAWKAPDVDDKNEADHDAGCNLPATAPQDEVKQPMKPQCYGFDGHSAIAATLVQWLTCMGSATGPLREEHAS